MSGLEAFALASGVMQTIAFGKEVIQTWSQISKLGSSREITIMRDYVNQVETSIDHYSDSFQQLELKSQAMEKSLQRFQQRSIFLEQHEIDLKFVATRCRSITKELQDMIGKTMYPSQGGLKQKLAAIRNTFYLKDRVKDLHNQLLQHENTLRTQILVHLKHVYFGQILLFMLTRFSVRKRVFTSWKHMNS